MKTKYKISVIMPIYNTARYLKDSIDSIINQTIGFEDNIQLIFVDDGSTDSSHLICNEYKNRFPDNIEYIYQRNLGSSSARNAGIPYVAGKYVNFFDSDDKWNSDAYEKLYNFIELHQDDIDVVSCPQCFFEAKSGPHNLNNKFKDGSRVIDINTSPNYIQLSVTSSLISAKKVISHSFDTRLAIGEDARFLTEIILDKEKFGAVHDTQYNIRKRLSDDSVTQVPPITKYTNTIDYYYKYLPELSIAKYGKIIPYIQHIMINGLKYRAVSSASIPLGDTEREQYVNDVISLIKLIDDEVILTTNVIVSSSKLYLLKLKYGRLPEEYLSIRNNRMYFKSILVGRMDILKISLVDICMTDNVCEIAGILKFPVNNNVNLVISFNDNPTEAELTYDPAYNRYSFNGDIITKGITFKTAFDLSDEINNISFAVNYNGTSIVQSLKSNHNMNIIKECTFGSDFRQIQIDKTNLIIK